MEALAKRILWFTVFIIFMAMYSSSLSAATTVKANTITRSPAGLQVAAVKSDQDPDEVQRYVVLLTDQPLALYNGGIKGLKATSLQATGNRKLDVAGADCQAYLNHLESKQAGALSTINQALGTSPRVCRRYQAVLNGFCLEMTGAQARRVSGMAGVKSVLPDVELHALTDAGPKWIGASDVWAGVGGIDSTKGEGIVVGIVDTGIYPQNSSFLDGDGSSGYDHTNPRGVTYGVCNSSLSIYDPTFPCNDKLIGAYDFARDEGDEYHPVDDDGHGSHTASTVAGNAVTAEISVESGNLLVLNRQISGVAPHANIISYRGLRGGSGWGSWLAAAIEQATLDQVDVINYSIGGSAVDPWGRADSLAFLAARSAGVFVAVSAGNSGPEEETLGAPADAPWVLSVGSSTHNRSLISELYGMTGSNGTLSDIKGMGITGGYGPAPIVYAGDFSNGTENPELCDEAFPSGTFPNDEIVVCDRGEAHMGSRLAKAANVKAGGAKGMVLANGSNMADSMVAMNFDLPAVSITFDDGGALKNWLDSGDNHVASIGEFNVVENDTDRADRVAAYSSRGPNPSAPGIIKPDVCAPGDNIYAAYGEAYPTAYAVLIGTSMASPHAAGAGALLKAARPDLSPAEIQSALTSTAQTGIKKEDSTTAADPFDMGGGRVDVSRAAKVALVLNETQANYLAADPNDGGDPTTLNLATLGHDQVVSSHTWTRTLRSTLGDASTWTASVNNPTGGTLTVTPDQFTIPAGGTQQIEIEVNLDGAALDTWLFGQVTLQSTGQVDVKMPVAVYHIRSSLDDKLAFITTSEQGGATVNMKAHVEITDFSSQVFGMVPGAIFEGEVYQDPTPGTVGDGHSLPENGEFVAEVMMGANAKRLVAEIVQTSAVDMDIYIYHVDTDSTLCASTLEGNDDYCSIDSPPAGRYYIIYNNFEASDSTGSVPDTVAAVVGAVTDEDASNLQITAGVSGGQTRTAIPAGENFDLRLDWTLDKDLTLDLGSHYWYGAFTIGTDSAHPSNLAGADIDVRFSTQGTQGGDGGSGCFIKTAE